MSPEDLLLLAREANLSGYPLPDEVEEWVSDAFLVHLETGERLDELLGLAGGKGRNARTKAQLALRDRYLRDAFAMLSPHYEIQERVAILMYDIEEFMKTKLEGYAVDENADEYELRIAAAIKAGGGQLPKGKRFYLRIVT
ncbi:hypothetical protein A3193_18545 [Candidatus Thiodiazotropha endoloripes]|uniref:hypothetical protein n=1 Tax=Candidatus Thiodiazotropha endoloripes TaxID=1818881 RepID=UPI00083DCBB5|nr:hypothetical protein [Candidatus Thiodiazotropha endoloripes]ODB82749.1 hypothetical protein A3193_18545 [Candidatus Thiodiazotropha endoloripes]